MAKKQQLWVVDPGHVRERMVVTQRQLDAKMSKRNLRHTDCGDENRATGMVSQLTDPYGMVWYSVYAVDRIPSDFYLLPHEKAKLL